MTRLRIEVDDVDEEAMSKILTLLGVGTTTGAMVKVGNRQVEIPPPPPPPEPVGWNAETARMLVDGVTGNAYRVLTMVCENNGRIGLDEVIETLDLGSGKALGGVMSSVGHSLLRLAEAGRLPHGERVIVRDEESRQFRAVVPKKVLTLLTNACHRRANIEAGGGIADVA